MCTGFAIIEKQMLTTKMYSSIMYLLIGQDNGEGGSEQCNLNLVWNLMDVLNCSTGIAYFCLLEEVGYKINKNVNILIILDHSQGIAPALKPL